MKFLLNRLSTALLIAAFIFLLAFKSTAQTSEMMVVIPLMTEKTVSALSDTSLLSQGILSVGICDELKAAIISYDKEKFKNTDEAIRYISLLIPNSTIELRKNSDIALVRSKYSLKQLSQQ